MANKFVTTPQDYGAKGDGSTNDTAAIQAAINALAASPQSKVLVIPAGTYILGSKVIRKTNVSIIGGGFGRAVFKGSFSGSADDSANCLVDTDSGVVSGGLATTITARSKKGSSSLALTSVTGLTVGKYIEVYGANELDEIGHSDGSGVISHEVVQIAAINALVVTTAWPLRVHHKSGASVREVTTIQNSEMVDIDLDGTGMTIAVGSRSRYALDDKVNVRVKNFTRAGVETYDGIGIDIQVRSLGGCNSHFMIDGSHAVDVHDWTSDPNGARTNASGVTRFAAHATNDCDMLTIRDSKPEHTAALIYVQAGHGLSLHDITARDVVPDETYTDMVAAGEWLTGQLIGCIATSNPVLVESANSEGASWRNIVIQDASSQLTDGLAYLFYPHDNRNLSIHGLRGINLGRENVGNMRGCMDKDNAGLPIRDLMIKGYSYGYEPIGSFAVGFDGYWYEATSGATGDSIIANIAISWSVATGPPMRNFRAGNVNVVSFPGISAIPADARIDGFFAYGHQWTQARWAVNKTGAVVATLDVVEIENGGTEAISGYAQFKLATGTAGTKLAVVIGGATEGNSDGTRMSVAWLPQAECAVNVRSADAVRPGDKLVVDTAATGGGAGGRYMMVNNAPATDVPYVVATSKKTAGAVAAVKVKGGR